MWRVEDIFIELDDEMTSDTIVTALITTPAGTLTFMAEPEVLGSTLVLHDWCCTEPMFRTVRRTPQVPRT